MMHFLPDVPLAVVIAHFLALGALFGPPIVRRVRRWQLKRLLAESSSPAAPYRPGTFRQLEPANASSGAQLKPQ